MSCWELTWKRLWLPRSEILNEVSSTTSHSPAPILIVGGVIGYCKIAEVVQYLRLRALLPHPSHISWLKKIWQEFHKNCGVHFPRWQIGDVMMWRPGLFARQPAGISFSARPRVQYASPAIANSLFPKKTFLFNLATAWHGKTVHYGSIHSIKDSASLFKVLLIS